MTRSGEEDLMCLEAAIFVLIPLLVDDPLWESDLLFSELEECVLIPLLVDDPLWARKYSRFSSISACLNPSFSG